METLVYYSGLDFTDCDFPLIKEYQQREGVKTYYFIPLHHNVLKRGLFNISKQIQKSGILPASSYEEFNQYKDFFDLSNVYIINQIYKGVHPLNFWLYLKFVILLIKLHPKTIHITHPLWGANILLYLFRKKLVLTVHDPFRHSGETSSRNERMRKLAFKLIPKIILLNGKQKKKFVEHYHLHGKTILENKLGVYTSLNFLSTKSRQVHSRPYILFFGRISPYKGVDVLCEAMTILRKKNTDIDCIIAGSGKLYFDISQYEHNDNIIFINRYINTDELSSLISNSLFVVCPYKDATQSGVVLSSFAFNKPVVATNVGALGESVIDGKSGLLVDPNNPDALAVAIETLLDNPEKVRSMSSYINESFRLGENSWKEIADKNLSFYGI